MSHVGEAVARYHKILESDSYKNSAWTAELLERMKAHQLLVGDKPVSPFLRPHFLTKRQDASLVKASESLLTSIRRVRDLVLKTPALMSRMELLPAEKMLAAVNPGYSHLTVNSQLHVNVNGELTFTGYSADMASGIAYADGLADIFYDSAPGKEFRKKHHLKKMAGMKHLLSASLKAWKEFGGKKLPNVAILEFKQPFTTVENHEHHLIAELFRANGYKTEVVWPEQLDCKGDGALRKGDFTIDIVLRRVKAREFLIRYDLTHPLVRAYREGKVCLINSFQAELAQKRAMFDLLSDDAITGSFPAAERKVIREHIPWTRMVTQAKVTRDGHVIDLPDYILKNRQKLTLLPNDDGGEQQSFDGALMTDQTWERALRTALRNPYVLRERLEPTMDRFPVLQWGSVDMKDVRLDLRPQAFLGKVQSFSAYLSPGSAQGFSTVTGVAPVFLLDSK